MTDVCIDPATAQQAGVDISTNSNESRTRVEQQFDEIEPARQANEGWQTGPALVEIVSARTSVDERYATSLGRIGKAVDSMSE
ncbi:hypothetical protein [Nocardia cerradoensis]|uniref:hypothetical protein n=1 Tax=Nocardia cerradoensis TaxID=85688 RepID=UPI000314D552|nr:hypothetical protein [Nocardia cerradoensis]NKY44320.1 hypothetical protein [Nocardia cerradoensis]